MGALRGHGVGGSRRLNGHWQSAGIKGELHIELTFPMYYPGVNVTRNWGALSAYGTYSSVRPEQWQNRNLIHTEKFVIRNYPATFDNDIPIFCRIELSSDIDERFFVSELTIPNNRYSWADIFPSRTFLGVRGANAYNAPAQDIYDNITTTTYFADVAGLSTAGSCWPSIPIIDKDIQLSQYSSNVMITVTNKVVYYGVLSMPSISDFSGIPQGVRPSVEVRSFDSHAQDTTGTPTGEGYIKIDQVKIDEVIDRGRFIV